MSTAFIDPHNFAINNRILHTQVLADPFRQIFEVAECVSMARDEFALTFSMYARERKPSIFNSKINWSESKGSRRRESRMGRRFRGSMEGLLMERSYFAIASNKQMFPLLDRETERESAAHHWILCF